MKEKICNNCTSYSPYEKLSGFLGTCAVKKKVTGFDQSCECHSKDILSFIKKGSSERARKVAR